MHKLRVYIDTSVVGGCFDSEFSIDSQALIEFFRKGEMIAVISETAIKEIKKAPDQVKEVIGTIPKEFTEIVDETQEAIELAELYMVSEAISMKSKVDAIHIAVATVNRADVLVSWNFKDIVNIHRIRAYNAINIREGYSALEIRSPKEVLRGTD